ncbi:unnamed protein product [Oppiella nova]|uniref:Protein kinase domain-containing protein n=1 Tax=Oppiella nova TaxID=334625 RepID=A0A7R9LEB0_9ACAR|nr:unnamed protein product [Oppiella nova]CAG2162266.1 unnamed protein product [Oppiella nova]
MGDKDKDNPEGLKVGKRYLVGRYLAGGSFGRLYTGKNIQTGEEVAIKMERQDIEKKQLTFEFRFFKILKAEGAQHKGIPRIYYFGPVGVWNALVMDLLGPSLEKVHDRCGTKFSLKTTIQLMIQLFDVIEYFHGKGLIYRDTKPENFLFGQSGTDSYSVVHIIDLGLCKEYLDDEGKHIPFVENKGVTGTVRYMSVNNNRGCEQGRRDDMEALGYMFIYLMKGELPWMGVKANTIPEKYRQIARIKERTTPEGLCADLPREFCHYLTAVRALDFADEPKYKDYIQMFSKLFKQKGFKNDNVYDFDRNHKPRR